MLALATEPQAIVDCPAATDKAHPPAPLLVQLWCVSPTNKTKQRKSRKQPCSALAHRECVLSFPLFTYVVFLLRLPRRKSFASLAVQARAAMTNHQVQHSSCPCFVPPPHTHTHTHQSTSPNHTPTHTHTHARVPSFLILFPTTAAHLLFCWHAPLTFLFLFLLPSPPTQPPPSFRACAVRKVDISAPLDFVHEVHVGFDPETGEFSVSSSSPLHRHCTWPLSPPLILHAHPCLTLLCCGTANRADACRACRPNGVRFSKSPASRRRRLPRTRRPWWTSSVFTQRTLRYASFPPSQRELFWMCVCVCARACGLRTATSNTKTYLTHSLTPWTLGLFSAPLGPCWVDLGVPGGAKN